MPVNNKTRRARAVMVLGTTSGAGKSFLATALCRWYARQGFKVAPYKAQNMSNNARVVPVRPSPAGTQSAPRGGAAGLGSGPAPVSGPWTAGTQSAPRGGAAGLGSGPAPGWPGLAGRMGEIGSAQYFQALAARCQPEVRMNPVLLKPEADTASQVVVLGEVDEALSRAPWRERSELLWPHARAALHELMDENEVVVIEGAGSPAEINLHASDYVNMRTAREVQAACLLATDIDRGGAFAHLYGTHQLLPPEERALIRGYVLNRFRGDARLLAPGPEMLQQLTGVPTMAVLPMWRHHGLPEEDGVFDEQMTGQGLRIAIVAYPRLSNLDEFQPLRQVPGAQLVWARDARTLQGADWIILPGSKAVAADLAWLREQRLDAALAAHAAAGKPLMGICGGLQMLGETLVDPHGIDGNAPGLGLLPLVTRFEREKLLRPAALSFAKTMASPWSALQGLDLEGYEIHHGRTVQHPSLGAASEILHERDGSVVGWQQANVLGLYAHGLFEQPALLKALFGVDAGGLEPVFEGLADYVDRHFAPGALMQLLEPSA